MEVDELRGALREAGERIPVDVGAGHHGVVGRARRRRTARNVALVVSLLAVAATIALAWPRGSSGPTVVTSRPGPGLALEGLAGVPAQVIFTDAHRGVGLTSRCTAPARADAVCDLGILATRDAGRTWALVGVRRHVVYTGWRGYPFINLAARGRDLWIYGTRTFASRDGGRTLHPSTVGPQVVSLVPRDRDAWALVRSCPPAQTCATTLVSATRGGTHWRTLGQAPALVDPYVSLVRPTARVAYLLTQDAPHALYRTGDGGQHWRRVGLPESTSTPGPVAFDALGTRDVWVATSSASPTMEQNKAIYHSTDAGAHWTLIATTASFASPTSAPGLLPVHGLVHSLRVVTPDRLWLSLDFGTLTGSIDGGRHWLDARVGGAPNAVDTFFLDGQHGWATTGDAVYRTTDGVHWTRLTG